jgi:hypothetical protein
MGKLLKIVRYQYELVDVGGEYFVGIFDTSGKSKFMTQINEQQYFMGSSDNRKFKKWLEHTFNYVIKEIV